MSRTGKKTVRFFIEGENNRVPDVQNGVPDFQNGVPEVQNGVSDVQNEVLDVQNGVPDVQNGVPDVQNEVPGVQNGVPDVQNTVPYIEDGKYYKNKELPLANENGHSSHNNNRDIVDAPQNALKTTENDAHPLLQHKVLQSLSKYLTYTDLKIGRMVCSDWSDILSPLFWNNSRLKIRFIDTRDSNSKDVSQFFNALSKRSDGHSREELSSIHIMSLGGFGSISMALWLKSFGPNLRSIVLSAPGLSFDYSTASHYLNLILTSWCPNLKELVLNEIVNFNEPFLPPDVEEIETRVVHLDRLEIFSSKPPQSYADYLALLILRRVLSVNVLNIQFSKVLGLNIFWQWYRRTFAQFVLHRVEDLTIVNKAMSIPICYLRTEAWNFLKLKRFCIGPLCSINDKYSMHSRGMTNFLQHFRGIEELVLINVNLQALEFPKLANLIRLTLFVDSWGTEDLSFVLNFPNLRVLVVQDREGNVLRVPLFKTEIRLDQIHINLRELTLTSKGVDFQNVIYHFPKLEELDVDLTQNDLIKNLSVFSLYPDLKNMSIVVNSNTKYFSDAIISTIWKYKALETLRIKASEYNNIIISCDLFKQGFMRSESLKCLVLEGFKNQTDPDLIIEMKKVLLEKSDLKVQFIPSP